MNEWIKVRGMVISAMPMGEYDRRVLLLTAELGKISAFIKGARRSGSSLQSAGRLFAFGYFDLYAGRSSYTVKGAEIKEYFEFLSEDPAALCYASYFAELAEYFGQEGAEDPALLKLLYFALRSLKNPHLNRPLVRYAYELKILSIEGEAHTEPDMRVGESAYKAWRYVTETDSEKCFLFTLEPVAFREFSSAVAALRRERIDKHFKSLDVLEQMMT